MPQKSENEKSFSPNNRTHIMIPRQHEHFQVLKANTNRFKESSIIHMQNQLNNDMGSCKHPHRP